MDFGEQEGVLPLQQGVYRLQVFLPFEDREAGPGTGSGVPVAQKAGLPEGREPEEQLIKILRDAELPQRVAGGEHRVVAGVAADLHFAFGAAEGLRHNRDEKVGGGEDVGEKVLVLNLFIPADLFQRRTVPDVYDHLVFRGLDRVFAEGVEEGAGGEEGDEAPFAVGKPDVSGVGAVVPEFVVV